MKVFLNDQLNEQIGATPSKFSKKFYWKFIQTLKNFNSNLVHFFEVFMNFIEKLIEFNFQLSKDAISIFFLKS